MLHYKLHPPGRGWRSWYVRGTGDDGRRFEKSTGEKDRRRAEEWVTGWIRGLAILGGKAPLTFGEAMAAYSAFRDVRRDDAAWLNRLSSWFGRRPIADILHASLIEAANELLPGRSPATKNRGVIGPASAVLHYAAEQGWCEYRRFRRFPEARRSSRKPAPDEIMAKLLAATAGHRRLLLALLYETGLRLGDALALGEDNIDLSAGAVFSTVAKTGERLRVGISPMIVAMIGSLPRARGGKLFPWSSRWAVYRWLRPLRKSLGVSYTPHQSRHALATELQRRRIPDKEAAEYGAWRDPRSLHRYQHVEPVPLEGRSAGALLVENGDPVPGKRRNPAA